MNVQETIAEVNDHMRGMWRFRWVALLISWGVAIVGWYFIYLMPNIYEASARVSVDTNSLLPELTKGLTATENLMSEVELVSKAMLTRPNLEAVARETDLDLRAETPQDMELLITGLQRRVRVVAGRDKIFRISYSDANRDKARDVVSSLLNTFVESSLGAQGADADMTERALAMEIENHEQRLVAAEADLAYFKKRNLGYMPDNGIDYFTRLQTATAAVSEADRQIRLMRQKRDEISRQLEGEGPVIGLTSSTSALAIANCPQASSIQDLRAQLSDLLVDFTEKHPRMVILRETIATIEAQCAKELDAMSGKPMVDRAGQSLDANPVYQNLRLQLSDTDVELAALQEQYRSSQREVARLRSDVDKISKVETDLKQLNRDYGVVEGRYQELLQRWETLQSKKRLDPVTDNVQFNILEPPYASAKPVAPNRPLLLIGVLIFSLGAGGVIAFGLNQLRPVFFTRHSVSSVAGLPVLGSVGLIASPDDIVIKKRMTAVWAGANLSLVLLAILVITFQQVVSQALRTLLGGVGV